MNNTVPTDWKKGVFSDVVKLDYGKSPKEIFDDNGKYPVIGTGGVTGFTNSYLHEGRTTVIGRKGTINNPSFISTKFWAIDTTYYVSEHKNADEKWFYYFIQNIDLTKFNEASGVPSLNRDTLYAIPCIAPSLLEQQKIAAILTAVDEVIAFTQAQISKLKNLKTAMMQELLTKGIGHTEFKDSPVGRIPARWQIVELGSMLTKIDSGWSPNCVEIPPNIGEWGVLKVSAVTRDVFLEEQSKTLPSNLEPRESIRVKQNDILLTRANGVAELVGKCVIVKEEPKRKLMMSDKLLRLNPNKKIHRNFLLHVFNSNVIRKQIEFCWGGSSGQKNIGQADIKLFALPLPPLDEQKIIGDAISQVDNFLDKRINKLDHLVATKKALMQDLLTGKVRVRVN